MEFPLDDAHPDDAHLRAVTTATDSLKYRLLVRLLGARDPKTEPSAPPGPLETLAEHIREAEGHCAATLEHHAPKDSGWSPLLPLDMKPV